MPHIFISYPDKDKDIVENLRHRLGEFGVDTWAYSCDKTLGKDSWKEIEGKIEKSKVIIFIASENTKNAEGQQRELELAFNKINESIELPIIFPIVIDDFPFSKLPEKLRHINGAFLSSRNIKSVTLEVTKIFFPQIFKKGQRPKWEYPKPDEWLEVCNLDRFIEEYCDIGDKLYFRRISPMGLFECYAPKIDALLWLAPENVKRTEIIDENGKIEREIVPGKYRNLTTLYCERKGYQILFLNKEK